MTKTNRRDLLRLGTSSLAFPVLALFSVGCKDETRTTTSKEIETGNVNTKDKKEKEIAMKIQYLEIVTSEPNALCKQYAKVHRITFGEPIEILGNARTATLSDGGQIGIRGPLRETETPVIRPYVLVENLEQAVAAAADEGAEIAIQSMELPGHGTIAVVIQGGIECGLWQL
ncbi:hypothetical protein SH139x_005375 [Planctomycetaceae bacterium SH139]